MQVGQKVPGYKVLFNGRHFIAAHVLEESGDELDGEPAPLDIGPDTERLGKTKLKVTIGTLRSNEAEITIMENKIPHRIGAT